MFLIVFQISKSILFLSILAYVPSAVRRSFAAITSFGPTENEFQSSNRMTRAQSTRKEREKELIHNIVTFCPTEMVSTGEEVKIFFHAVRLD